MHETEDKAEGTFIEGHFSKKGFGEFMNKI